MANTDRQGGYALAISVPTALALALSYLKGQKTGEAVIPDEVVQLICAIAATSEEIKASVQAILDKLDFGDGNGGVGQGWPPNATYIRSTAITCVAAATAYQAPIMLVPSGMALVIKAHPLNAAGSIIAVATTPADCLNPNSAYPLLPSEAIAYHIQNAEVLYVSSNVAGSVVVFSTEQEV